MEPKLQQNHVHYQIRPTLGEEWIEAKMSLTEPYNISATVQHKYDIIDKKGVQVLFFIVYTTIFVVGLFGNVLVCYVVFRNKAMQTVTNLFITNLALSDILLCVLAVPFTPLYTFFGKWVFGSYICHMVPYAQGTSVYISTLTLMSIAIDRWVFSFCCSNDGSFVWKVI